MSNKPDVKPSEPDKYEKMAREFDEKHSVKAAGKGVSKVFNPAALVEQSKKIYEEDFPLLGKLKYGELTLADSFVITKCKTDEDKTAMAAFLMLKKAYPDMPTYTPETIHEWTESMPMAEGAALLLFFKGTPAFLRAQSLSGLQSTATLKR
jgi:hypothetical protein